nr:MAG TPA: hypothetical protein [Caudoviricetes sp.]
MWKTIGINVENTNFSTDNCNYREVFRRSAQDGRS